MKNLFTLLFFGLIPLFLFGQIPQAFNYQAVVRDASGNIKSDTIVTFKIEILQNGTSVFSEVHDTVNTGPLGIVNFKVGIKNPDDFSDIDWSAGQFKIRVSIGNDPLIGEAEIVAVPFALMRKAVGIG